MNIDFDGSNSSQVGVYNAKIDPDHTTYRTVHCRPEDLTLMKAFLEDVRTMPEEEWMEVMECIDLKNPQKESKNDAE